MSMCSPVQCRCADTGWPLVLLPLSRNIAGAIWFFTTVQTTIGYGLFAPVTAAGQFMTATIGLCGIIVFGYFVGKASEKINTAFNLLAGRFPALQDAPRRKLLVYIGGVFVYMLFFAGISMPLLGTDYGTSLYFTTVTFSTMGKT